MVKIWVNPLPEVGMEKVIMAVMSGHWPYLHSLPFICKLCHQVNRASSNTISFLPLCLLYTVRKTCPNEPRGRRNCGFPGITPQQCAKRGCCFRAHPAGVPWCYYHRMEEGNVCMRQLPHIPMDPPGLLAGPRLRPSLMCCVSLVQREAIVSRQWAGQGPPASLCGCRASSPRVWVGKSRLNPKRTSFFHRGVGVADASEPGTCGKCGCTGSLNSGVSSSPQLMQW